INKAIGDEYMRDFRDSCGMEYVSLRYANVYGPRQDGNGEAGVVGIFSQKMLNGDQPVINGNGRQTRDFTYVDDIVEANVAALAKTAHGIYNVGTGQETSINELFGILAKLINPAVREVHGPAKKGEQQQKLRRIHAAHSLMALHDDFRLGIQFLIFRSKRSERNQLRALDFGNVVLPRFPDVYQDNFLSFIQFLLQFLHRDREAHTRFLLSGDTKPSLFRLSTYRRNDTSAASVLE